MATNTQRIDALEAKMDKLLSLLEAKVAEEPKTAEQPIAKNPIVIPKTGDAPGMIAFTAVSAASLFGIGKIYAMACKKGRKGGKGGRGGGC